MNSVDIIHPFGVFTIVW